MKYIFTLLLSIGSGLAAGQTIDSFTLSDANSDKSVSLSDYSNKKGIVVIFTSNVCPYAIYYEGRITQLIAEFKNKDIQFLLINSHFENKETKEEMVNKIDAWGLRIPYLVDKDKVAMNALGARKSPEAFILKPVGDEFSVYYSGAIDNNPQVATDVKDRYLRDNISNIIAGRPATKGGRPIGCMIK